MTVQSTDAAAQSAIQYFENMRNFLVAVSEMQLLTFEASDLEKVLISVLDFFSCLIKYKSKLSLYHNFETEMVLNSIFASLYHRWHISCRLN